MHQAHLYSGFLTLGNIRDIATESFPTGIRAIPVLN